MKKIECIIRAVSSCCQEEIIGCGKIAVLPLEECVRIRTQERGVKAIV